MNKGFVAVLGLLLTSRALHASPDFTVEGDAWWAYVEKLANDSMEGRNMGSPAYSRAAEFVAGEFASAGLRPAGTKGFLQPMKFDVRQIDEAHSSLELVHNGQAEWLSLSDDANFNLPSDMA